MAADEVIDLSAPAGEDPKTTVQLAQFKRDLSHILIKSDSAHMGPEITIGPYTLQFKEKVPVAALAELVGNDDRVAGMRQYIKLSLVGDPTPFDEVLTQIDLEGLGEILEALGEGYTSFPAKS